MTNEDLYEFGATKGDDRRGGLPPVVGDDGASTWLSPNVSIECPVPRFAEPSDGISLLIDVQPDSVRPLQIIGSLNIDGASLQVTMHDGAPNRLTLGIRDGDGRLTKAYAELSQSSARRLAASYDFASGTIVLAELQPWAPSPGQQLHVDYDVNEHPASLILTEPLWIGGDRTSYPFAGRVADFAVFDRALSEAELGALTAATGNPMRLTTADLAVPSAEIVDRIRRDVIRLREWAVAPMYLNDMDDASLLLFRWFFDRHPILVEVARMLGVQIWMPGDSAQASRYAQLLISDGASLHIPGERGPDAPMGFAWVTVDEWKSQPAFHAEGRPVTREAFVKFVRHKLGAGHYDEVDRAHWQRDLLRLTSQLRLLDQDALAFQMKALAREALLAVSVSRIEGILGLRT